MRQLNLFRRFSFIVIGSLFGSFNIWAIYNILNTNALQSEFNSLRLHLRPPKRRLVAKAGFFVLQSSNWYNAYCGGLRRTHSTSQAFTHSVIHHSIRHSSLIRHSAFVTKFVTLHFIRHSEFVPRNSFDPCQGSRETRTRLPRVCTRGY